MKKILFMIATVYVLGVFVVAIPAFSTSSSFFIKKYEAGEEEKAIIKDVHGQQVKGGTDSIRQCSDYLWAVRMGRISG